MATNGEPQPSDIRRYAVDFAVDGDIKFLSHQDTIRMFARALTRAAVPVRFTQGFNPRPRFSLPLPRPVGIASDAERLVVDLTDELPDDDLLRRLQEQMPRGIRILRVHRLRPSDRCLPIRVLYRVSTSEADVSALRGAAADLLAAESVVIDRRTGEKSPTRRVDVRPFIERIDVADDCLVVTLQVSPRGTARPSEVLALLGMQDEAILDRVRRIEVLWQ